MERNKLVVLVVLGVGLCAWGWSHWDSSEDSRAVMENVGVESPALRVTLVDEAGAPLACRATLWRVGDGERKIWPGAGGACVDGQLTWESLESGSYRLMAQPPGRVLVDIDLDYVGDPIDLGEQASAVGGIVRGVVLQDGEPVYGAVLALSDGRRHTESGPDGTFAFPGVALGEVVVRAALNGAGAVQSVEVGSAGPAEMQLELEKMPDRGVLGLRFEMESGAAVVREIHPAGPAVQGLFVGDRLEGIGGTTLDGLLRQDVVRLLSGVPGETVVLSVRRAEEIVEVELVRVAHSSL